MKIILHELEHIRDIFRQSKFIFVKPALIAGLLVVLPWYFGSQYGLTDSYSGLLYLWTILVVIYFVREIVIWHMNEYVVTNKRLIKISHDGLFKRTVIETPMERILNVSYKTTGLSSVIFRFGDVEVQVVGLVEPIVLRHIPQPARTKDYLWQLHGRVVTKEGQFAASDIAHVQERMGYTKKDQRIL